MFPTPLGQVVFEHAFRHYQRIGELRQRLLTALIHMRQHPARHVSNRPPRVAIDEIVLHDTASGADFPGALRHLAGPNNRSVSAHYLIGREHGQIYAMVPEEKRAHHADDHNCRSIGIEMYKLASDKGDFTDWQYTAVSQLVYEIRWRRRIRKEKVVSHRALNPKNRSDPRNFDWARFERLIDQLAQRARALGPGYAL
jgi:N-acetyl-anhydromuramyl-L-alanine amidase AmpD